MSSRQALIEIEARLPHLNEMERRKLLKRLAREVRTADAARREQLLAEMATDPDIQRETKAINEEFACCENDG